MNKRYRSYLYSLAILLLSAALTLAVKYRPRGLSEEECGPLYRQYAHAPGIEASFVKGFRVNDTLFLDATLLRAKDTAAWERLLNDFHLVNAIDTSAYRQPHSFSISMVSPKDPTKRISSPDEPFCSRVAFPYEREIHIYSTENDDHCIALHMHLMLNLSKHQTIKRK